MSEYFSYFPTTQHDLTNIGQKVTLTNVLRRFIVRSDVRDRADIFYPYNVQHGERPDTIAEKYYGDADLAWLVLHFNDIVDPVFGWALFGHDFDQYIIGKYGSIAEAQSEVHEYRWVTKEREVKYDGTVIPEMYKVIDSTSATTLTTATAQATINNSGGVSSIAVTHQGMYTTSSATPTVTVDAPFTQTATAICTLSSGAVNSVSVIEQGAGYTSTPTVTFSAPSSGTTATGTAVMDSTGTRVRSITITEAGSGYTNVPTVTIGAPTQGTTATATVSVFEEGKVKKIAISSAGTGYTFAPSVTISGGTANLSQFAVSKYDWEIEQNEKKREIKILDKRYVDKVVAEVETVLRDGI